MVIFMDLVKTFWTRPKMFRLLLYPLTLIYILNLDNSSVVLTLTVCPYERLGLRKYES